MGERSIKQARIGQLLRDPVSPETFARAEGDDLVLEDGVRARWRPMRPVEQPSIALREPASNLVEVEELDRPAQPARGRTKP